MWLQDIFSGDINTIETKNNCFKALSVPIQQYTAVDFQGWLKMTLTVKMAFISIFRRGFWKILWQPFVELHMQA